jgi:hypothetical protein
LNWPILLLNLVLVITAILAGYHRAEVVVDDDQEERGMAEPGAPSERLSELREALRQHRGLALQALADTRRTLNRAEQLFGAEPFRQWEGVAERLNCVIPAFRSENARLRALDTRDILAFQLDSLITFAAPQYTPDQSQVARVDESRAAMHALSGRLESLERGRGERRSQPDSDAAEAA